MIDATANDALDAQEACPCCLLGPQQRCLKTPYTHLDNTETYSDMLKECFNIQLDVASDTCGICEECAARLRDASHFKRQVQRSQVQLQERLARALQIIEAVPPAVVKSEIADEDGESANLLGEELADDMAGGGGAAILEPPVEMADNTGSSEESADLQVKEEVADCLKEEWEDSAACGVSETAALVELYAGHEVKDELVLGPEGLQPQDIVFTLYAAPALNVKEQRVPRDCVVRVERVQHVEGLLKSKTHSNTNIATDRDTYLCDVCEKRFALQTQLMEHAMIHIRQSSEREGTRGVADDEPHRDHTYAKTGPTLAEVEPPVEMADGTGTSEDSADCEEADIKSERADDEGTSDDSPVPRSDSGSAHARSLSARARQQLAMTCSVRLERLRDEDREYTRDTSATQLTSKPTPLALQEHTRTAYCCHICSKTFPRKTLFTGHLRTHNVKKAYACDICNKQFTQKSHLQRHFTIHTGQKPYTCDICNKQFTQKGHLQTHVRIHTGQKSYTCDICNKQFAYRHVLQTHVRIHRGQKPYTCDICNKQFTQIGHLNVHLRIHTGQKPYTCDICNKQFAYRNVLQNHVRKHTGMKPYTCNICNKQFAYRTVLQNHVRIHTGLKPYTCDICNKQFTQKGTFNKHVRIHSRHTLA